MRMPHRYLLAAALLAGLARPALAESLKVRTDWLPWGIHAGLFLAAQKGWFKDAGLDVQLSDGKGSSLTLQQVATGDVDVGQVQLAAMALARSIGLPVISIAGLARQGDLAAIVPDDEPTLTDVKSLRGKTIVYAASSAWGPLVDLFLKSGGLTRSDVTLLNVDQTSLLSLYATKKADAVLSTLPFAKPTADRLRASHAILTSDAGITLPSYGLVVNSTTYQAKSETLKKFVPIVVRAWAYIYDGNPAHIDEAVQAIASQRPTDKLDLSIIKDQIIDFKPFFWTKNTQDKPIGWQSPEDWQATITMLEQVKSIKPGSKPSDYFTNSFIAP